MITAQFIMAKDHHGCSLTNNTIFRNDMVACKQNIQHSTYCFISPLLSGDTDTHFSKHYAFLNDFIEKLGAYLSHR